MVSRGWWSEWTIMSCFPYRKWCHFSKQDTIAKHSFLDLSIIFFLSHRGCVTWSWQDGPPEVRLCLWSCQMLLLEGWQQGWHLNSAVLYVVEAMRVLAELNATSWMSDQRNSVPSLVRSLNGRTVSNRFCQNLDKYWHLPQETLHSGLVC